MTVDRLRHIAQQVDQLIRTINNGGGAAAEPGASAAPAASAAPGGDAALLPHVKALAETLELQPLMTQVTESAAAVTGGERAFLMMLEDGNKLRYKAGHQIDQQALASNKSAGIRMVIKQVLHEGRPLCLHGQDLPKHGLIHLSGLICVPLRFGRRQGGIERLQGALYVDSVDPQRALTPERQGVLETLADHAGVAIENAQILQQGSTDHSQVLRLRDNITRLYEVGRSINETLILDDLLVRVVDHVVEVSRAQRGFIMLFEGPEGDRRLQFKTGRDARHRDLPEEHFKYSTTIAQKAIEERQAVVMTEALGADLSVSMVQMELQSIMCVPLIEKEEVFGLVYVDSQQSNREFDESDKEIMESLCGQASVAVINAKLYEEKGERERLAQELDIAARLQREMLPREFPPVQGLEVWGLLTPATEVGGDYYDFIPHEGTDRSLTIAIGDVSGKGVGAGLVMAMARSTLRSLVQHYGAPESTLPIARSLNVMLCRGIPREMFMTLNVLLWDAGTGQLRYTAQGHEHVLVYRAASREVETIKAGGVASGVLESASDMLREHTIDLQPGDQVLLYTDGVTEAMTPDQHQFSLERTVALLQEHGQSGPKTLCEVIEQATTVWRGIAQPNDDITLVALRVPPASA